MSPVCPQITPPCFARPSSISAGVKATLNSWKLSVTYLLTHQYCFGLIYTDVRI
jgi:hypothetical protein